MLRHQLSGAKYCPEYKYIRPLLSRRGTVTGEEKDLQIRVMKKLGEYLTSQVNEGNRNKH